MNHRELIAQLTPLHGAGEARAIVRMIMEERFGLSQTDLLLGKDTTLSEDNRIEFEKIAFRLLAGEPVQHVLGYADFYGHRFRVTPDVLIPRPETEELVAWAVAESSAPKAPILDLCTGSGCIAISLGLAFPETKVVGVDISEAALEVGRTNAETLGASNVDFIQQDVLKVLLHGDSCFPGLTNSSSGETEGECFSMIVSNPPYVCEREAAEMTPTVLDHEPHLALFVPDDHALCFYRAIAAIALRSLLSGGLVFVEINTAMAEATRQLFVAEGFADVEVRCDQFGRPRMLRAKRP